MDGRKSLGGRMAGLFGEPQPSPSAKPWTLAATLASIGGVLLFALLTRLPNFNANPFWLDEAWRGNLILMPDWFGELLKKSQYSTITSVGYSALNEAAWFINPSTFALRLTSLVPGIASVVLILEIATRLSGSRLIGCVAGLAAALNPTFIWHSKEFKPYELELFLHLSLILLALLYAERVREKQTTPLALRVAVFVAGPIAALTAANIIFLLPGYYLLLGWSNISQRKIPWDISIAAAACLGVLIWEYLFIWSGASRTELVSTWRTSFPEGDRMHLGWAGWRSLDILDSSLQSRFGGLFSPDGQSLSGGFGVLKLIVSLLAVVLAIAGIAAAAVWRRPERFCLIILPILGVVAANQLFFWPLGAVRPNLFLYGYFILLTAMGAGFLGQAHRWLLIGPAIAGLAWFGIVSFPADVSYYANSTGPSPQQVPQALTAVAAKLPADCPQRIPVLTTPAALHATRFYTEHDAGISEGPVGQALKRCADISGLFSEAYADPEKFSTGLQDRLASAPTAWLVWSNLNSDEYRQLLVAAGKVARVDQAAQFTNAGYFRVTLLSAPAQP